MPVDCRGCLGGPLSGPEGHQIIHISLVLEAYWHIGMFVFFVIFVPFPENGPIFSAFILHLDGAGGSGHPPGAPRWAFRRPEAASNCSYFVGFKRIMAHWHGYVSRDLLYVFSRAP